VILNVNARSRKTKELQKEMGGPCHLVQPDGTKIAAPDGTDNFQVRKFTHDGEEYYSCEAAYQALKFISDNPRREAIRMLAPKPNESDAAHGNACWALGQGGTVREDFELKKVEIMYQVNKSKYLQHQDLRNELLQTGTVQIVGSPSTTWVTRDGVEHYWQQWNGFVQIRIREELRSQHEREPGVLEGVVAQFERYASMTAAEPRNEMAAQISRMHLYGLQFPFTCKSCTFRNQSFPQMCEICSMDNPSFAPALQVFRMKQKAAKVVADAAEAAHATKATEVAMAAAQQAVKTDVGHEQTKPQVVCIGDLHGILEQTKHLYDNMEVA
jgi:predicted NAD-dependent protein-ADP-ribosyltransferase YbiA (DUF1768 family)